MAARTSSRVHPKYKTRYRVKNWREYEQGLRARGDVTIWFGKDAIAAWIPRGKRKRGGQREYSDLAIETALTLRMVFHLPLRQTEGFVVSLLRLMDLDLNSPDHSTLSRRAKELDVELRTFGKNRDPSDRGQHRSPDPWSGPLGVRQTRKERHTGMGHKMVSAEEFVHAFSAIGAWALFQTMAFDGRGSACLRTGEHDVVFQVDVACEAKPPERQARAKVRAACCTLRQAPCSRITGNGTGSGIDLA